MRRLAPALIVIVLAAGPARAGVSRSGGVLFQKPFGARPYALGQAYTGLGDDVFGLHYNPASLTRLKDSQFATQFVRSLEDTSLGYLAAATPLNPHHALGLAAAYFDAGKADIFDATGARTRTLTAQRDLLLQLGYAYARELGSGRGGVGVSGKALRSTIAEEMETTAFAGDLGAYYEQAALGGRLSVGAAAANLGPDISYSGGIADGSQADPLPRTMRLGLGYSKRVFNTDSIAVGLEADRVLPDDSTFLGAGLEYAYRGAASARIGYREGTDLGGLRMGVGLHVKNITLDYAFGLTQTFSNSHHVSLHYRFIIPGIRYSKDAAPSPLEKMAADIQSHIAGRRWFNAWSALQALDAFYPGTNESERFRRQIESEVIKAVFQGEGSPLYNYALAFKHFRDQQWEPAVEKLKAVARAEPANREVRKPLEEALKNLEGTRKQLKLEREARIGTLFALASQAFEEKDLERSLRILEEVSRLGTYQPAKALRNRIASERRQAAQAARRKGRKAKAPAPKPVVVSTVSPATARMAEQIYYESLRLYAENQLEQALKRLKDGLLLDPASKPLKNTLERIEAEYRQKERQPQ